MKVFGSLSALVLALGCVHETAAQSTPAPAEDPTRKDTLPFVVPNVVLYFDKTGIALQDDAVLLKAQEMVRASYAGDWQLRTERSFEEAWPFLTTKTDLGALATRVRGTGKYREYLVQVYNPKIGIETVAHIKRRDLVSDTVAAKQLANAWAIWKRRGVVRLHLDLGPRRFPRRLSIRLGQKNCVPDDLTLPQLPWEELCTLPVVENGYQWRIRVDGEELVVPVIPSTESEIDCSRSLPKPEDKASKAMFEAPCQWSGSKG